MDDLLQEATVALWRDRERLLSLSALPQAALIWKIGHNAVIDCLRRVKETEALPENYEVADEDRSLLRELHERIALLDEPDRSIVRLQLEGYNYVEIGEQVGMTEKNVSVRLVRIKEKLRKSMGIYDRKRI
jgi:RNA polymerase sigma-70 factor (ECF subfamily)